MTISLEKHIPPNVRRELCARLIYFDSIQPLKYKPRHDDSSFDPRAVAAIDELGNTLFNIIIQEELAVETSLANESFLSRVFSRLNRVAEPQLEKLPELLADLKSVLQEKVITVSCTNCNSCDSGATEALFGTTGCCMTSLRQMFNVASETAAKYYAEFATLRPRILPSVIFCTQHVRERNNLHELPVPYAVTGSTKACADSQQHWSEVRLKLCVPAFDLDSYMAIPYVLLHECIVHAYQDTFPTCEDRFASEPDDSFLEGWMDYVTLKIVQEVIAGQGPAADFGRSGLISQEHAARASVLYQSRISLDTAPHQPSQYAIYRKAGAEVADKVLNVLEKLPKSRYQPWAALLKMSFDLNLSKSFTSTRRKHFIGVLGNLVRRGKFETEKHREIVSLIYQYLDHGDATTLVTEVVNLPGSWGQKRPITGPLPRQIPLIPRPTRRQIH